MCGSRKKPANLKVSDVPDRVTETQKWLKPQFRIWLLQTAWSFGKCASGGSFNISPKKEQIS
jgi:hypothetical protein